MNEYLNPVKDAYDFIQDIIRCQYRIYVLTSNLVSKTGRHMTSRGGKAVQEQKRRHRALRKQLQKGSTNNYTGQGFARAKIAAVQYVRGRLVQGATTIYSPYCP
jgi:hypothetical protein